MLKAIGLNLLNNRDGNDFTDAATTTDNTNDDGIEMVEYRHEKVIAYNQIYTRARYTTVQEYLNRGNGSNSNGGDDDAVADTQWYGIPRLYDVFVNFDTLNNFDNCLPMVASNNESSTHYQQQQQQYYCPHRAQCCCHIFSYCADYIDFHHVDSFLNLISNVDTLQDILKSGQRHKDALVDAIFSFMMNWTDASFEQFVERFPAHRCIVSLLQEQRKTTPVYFIVDPRVQLQAPMSASETATKAAYNYHRRYYTQQQQHHYRRQPIVPHQQLSSPPSTRSPKHSILFLRSHIRILTRFYNRLLLQQHINVYSSNTDDKSSSSLLLPSLSPPQPTFDIRQVLSDDLLAHLQQVHRAICNETVDAALCALIENEQIFLTKYAATPLIPSGNGGGGGKNGNGGPTCYIKRSYPDNCMHIITGQACCGKTTLSIELKKAGWTMLSRGDIGTFSGKSKSPASVAALHAAMEYAFRRSDVIGDRGPIDNPLWSFIMQLCDPRVDMKHVVYMILDFFSQNFNDNALRYYAEQHCVVFIDPLPSCNQKRMLNRGTGGDSNRARLQNYFIQAIAYYIVARICGWKVYTVPYNLATKTYQPERYEAIARDILVRFGRPRLDLANNAMARPISNLKPSAAAATTTTPSTTADYRINDWCNYCSSYTCIGGRYDDNAITASSTTVAAAATTTPTLSMEYAQAVGIYK